MKSKAFHSRIQRTAYEALFGCKAKVCLRTSYLPEDILQGVQIEEELENILIKSLQTLQMEETDNR